MTPAQQEKILDRIACGKASVDTACVGICDPSTFFRAMSRSPELQVLYRLARAARADARFESVDAVLAAMKAGDIDAQVGRVLMDAIKWQCGKENANVYGDRITQELTGPNGGPILMSVADTLRQKRAERIAGA